MSENNLFRSYSQIFTAIEHCITNNLFMPVLVLIYSSIDSISWVASESENQSVAECFESWVNLWMLNKYPLPCTATELYAARCGILHTLTPNSTLSDIKGVNKIYYAWGKAKPDDMNETTRLLNYPGLVTIHLENLFNSFKNGFADYLDSLEQDSHKKELFATKANKHFAITNISTIKDFLDHYKDLENNCK
jgi:hypothetical protein